MMKKIYIWNDLYIFNERREMFEVPNYLKNKVTLLNNIEEKFINDISHLNNIVTIGTRPKKFLNKKNTYNINSKRILFSNGFAKDSIIVLDDKIKLLKEINIVEDIIVTGKTLSKIIENLGHNQIINIYLLIGYKDSIESLYKKYKNVNIYCYNVLEEEPVTESTCIFLSDLLYEKLGDKLYINHIKDTNALGNKTMNFIKYIKKIKSNNRRSVAIVTITLGINFGNRLQNYALQEVLKKLELNPTTFENVYQEKTLCKKIKRNIILLKKRINIVNS